MDVDSSDTSSIVSFNFDGVCETLNQRVITLMHLIEKYQNQKLLNIASSDLASQIVLLVDTIDETLDILKNEGNHAKLIQIYTQILEYHCNNSIYLIEDLYHTLFYCKKPQLIHNLFNNGLLNSKYFDIVLKADYLFDSIDDMDEYSHSYSTLLSICLILYKINSKMYCDTIKTSIRRHLVFFILYERYDNRCKDVSLNWLFKAFVLNGILDNYELRQLLNRRQELSENNLVDNNQDQSIAQKLSLNTINLTNKFPLSLQYLTRIAIKNYMNFNYNKRNVEQFQIPDVIKKFLLFDKEINEIIHCC